MEDKHALWMLSQVQNTLEDYWSRLGLIDGKDAIEIWIE